MGKQFYNLDANESIFFNQELEKVLARMFEVDYPELRARRFLPVSGEAGPAAETITYYQFDKVGMAKLISDYATDLPTADVFGQKFSSPVESLGIKFIYSLQEVRASAMAGRSLPMMKADAARRAHEQKVDEIAALGDAATGMTGFLNNANIPQQSNLAGANWSTLSADQILADLNQTAQKMFDDTNAVETPDTILLPPDQYALISTLRVGDTQTTVLRFFLQTSPWIRNVDHWYRLKGAGAGATDRMVTYRRDPSKLELQIPQEFETMPVQENDLRFEVPTHSRIGGVTVYKPLSALYTDGI
jgi:hypothetical protein